MRSLRLCGAFCVLAFPAAHGQKIRTAHCGPDNRMHLSYTNGASRVIAKEPDTVGCEDVIVASDQRTVGWLVDIIPNCCPPIPISTTVLVLTGGRKRLFYADQAVWGWQFVEGASKLAMLSGPVHGKPGPVILYRISDRKRLAEWWGKGTAPAWAARWEKDLASEAPAGPN